MPDGFGKYDVNAVAGSAYCYKDSNVLRNKLGIRDGVMLRRIEADISAARQTELVENPVSGRFTPSHLCNIHRRLLGDVYPFAGHFRREDIAKGETRFLGFNQIGEKLTSLLSGLRAEHDLAGLNRAQFIKRSAYYMAELNYIHPFREGNGRATREFMRLLFLRNGYKVDWSAVPVDNLLQAMVDSIYETAQLEDVLDNCLQKADE
jgi:cell filamentation protein